MQARSIVLRAACVLALVFTACTKAEDSPAMMNGAAGTVAGTGEPAAGMTGGSAGEAGTTAGTTAGESGTTGGTAGEPPIGGAAGEGGTAGMETGGMGGAGGDTMMEPEDPRGKCTDLDTDYPGDDACILPPAEGEGFQIHIGPEDYDNPGQYEVPIGQENSLCVSFHTPNTEDAYYQTFVLSGRVGTHHIIDTMYTQTTQIAPGEFQACLDPGTGSAGNIVDTLPGASKPYMPRGVVAPEDVGAGRMIPANAPSQADMHYYNFTDGPLLREFWLNIYTVPADQITEEVKPIRGMGGVGWSILPTTDKVYQYTCPITSAGRITSLLGHYHAHGKRFSAYIQRASGAQEKVFEMYDYNEPAQFGYNSVEMNPAFSTTAAGARSGTLEVAAGDTLQWECHIINDSALTLDYSNRVENGEMCNIWGATVGPNINCVKFSLPPPFPEEHFEVQ